MIRTVVELSRRSLRSYRRPLLVWFLSLFAVGLLLSLFWPAVRDASGLEDMIQQLPEAMQALVGAEDLLSPAGFLASRLNSIFPLLITIYASFRVADELAGHEQRGGWELVLGAPVPRIAVVVATGLVVAVTATVLMAATGAGLILGATIVSMDIALTNIVAAVAMLALLGIAFAGLGLAVAGATGSRGVTLGAGAGLAVGLFLAHTFAQLVPWLEPIAPFTLFSQALGSEPLRTGFPVLQALILIAVALVGAAIGAVAFARRDLHGT